MSTIRWSVAAILIGSTCIAAAALWPAAPDPRLRWTNEKSADYMATSQQLKSLTHDLADAMDHAAGDSRHVHSEAETISDPRLTALERERVEEHSAALQAELEAARQIPPGWHLLVGLIGGLLVAAGCATAAIACFRW
jgi:hypothetical protein